MTTTAPTPSIDNMSDDDDMLLLAASQIDMTEAVTSTQASQPTARHTSQPPRSQPPTSQPPTRLQPPTRAPATHIRSPPVGVVQPLRTIAPSNSSSSGPANKKSMKSQSSITSFMVSKSNSSTTTTDTFSSTPSFSLLDSDDEFLSDLPLPPSIPPPSQTVPALASFHPTTFP